MVKRIHITTGSGPAECALGAALVLREIEKEANLSKIKIIKEEIIKGEKKGTLASAVIRLEGETLLPFIKSWSGTILWRSASPYRPGHKRKNWYVGVREIDNRNESYSVEGSVKIATTRSSGPGGQHVNKTDSAVRITHLPTGISMKIQNRRSQYQNKKKAFDTLREKLKEKEARGEAKIKKGNWRQSKELERGRPIRIYRGSSFLREKI